MLGFSGAQRGVASVSYIDQLAIVYVTISYNSYGLFAVNVSKMSQPTLIFHDSSYDLSSGNVNFNCSKLTYYEDMVASQDGKYLFLSVTAPDQSVVVDANNISNVYAYFGGENLI